MRHNGTLVEIRGTVLRPNVAVYAKRKDLGGLGRDGQDGQDERTSSIHHSEWQALVPPTA